jgi:hypothetical protein
MQETRVCAQLTALGRENLYRWDSLAEQDGFEPPVPLISGESGGWLSQIRVSGRSSLVLGNRPARGLPECLHRVSTMAITITKDDDTRKKISWKFEKHLRRRTEPAIAERSWFPPEPNS